MKKSLFILFAVLSFASSPAQTEISGVKIPNSDTFNGEQLSLNGAGVREKFLMDMYVGALYLPSKSEDANAIMSSNKPMAIKIHIVSGLISSEKMIDAIDEGFENSTNGKVSGLTSEINKFKSFFSDKISKQDVFDIVYTPQDGVTVYKNGKEKGSIQGMEFKKAVFGIWLSADPADKDLKKSMLGKK